MTALLEAGSDANLIPLVAGVAIAVTMRDEFGVEAVLKWPNDVLIDGRKVGGVLVDAEWSGDERSVILLGIGVNLNNAIPKYLEEATSLSEESGEEINVETFLERLLENLDGLLPTMETYPREIIVRWEELSETLGRRIVVKDPSGNVFEGVADSIDSDGALKLVCGDRSIRVLSGTVMGR
jgi:BirA family biotin operon repressor/biotin-[acetyl-CoA-carboxylase] ligase